MDQDYTAIVERLLDLNNVVQRDLRRLSNAHAGEQENQENPVVVSLTEIVALLPDPIATRTSREQRSVDEA